MSAEYSFLCGYSYAWQAGYKPQAFTKLEGLLLSKKPPLEPDLAGEVAIKDRALVEHIEDSYGKLGFLFLSRDYIREVNGKHPLAHTYVSYHLFNFIYDTKAFLDALAVMLNDFYAIGETKGGIDFKHKSFRDKVIRETKLEKTIGKHEDWFLTVATWRRDLIHRFSTTIAPFASTDKALSRITKQELDQWCLRPCMMLQEPTPLLTGMKKLEEKYGKGNMAREIDPFCEEWIENARDLYDHVCNAIADTLDLRFNS